MKNYRTIVIAFITATGLLALSKSTAQADSIHRQLRKHVPQVISYLHGKGYNTVGVLKFRVKKPGEKTTDSAGSVNSLLADRLEVGLILGNSFDESKQLQIIKDASGQVAKVSGATHLTADGRRAMFTPEYKLAWGDKKAKADAFLTGVVVVDEGSQTANVGVLCFDKNGTKLERACEVFQADLDASILGEMGESFVLRGAFDGGASRLTFKEKQKQREQKIRLTVKEVRDQSVKFPLTDSAAPVRLQVLYDGKPVEIKIRKGRAFVPEPVTGQEVQFAVIRNATAKGRLGIVLKVNGENTLDRETRRDLDCRKWILGPEDKQVLIKGYQTDKNTAEEFKVLSRSESAKRAMDYGRNVGLIQLTVFQELVGPKPTLNIDEDEEDLLAMLRGTQPGKSPGSLSALKRQIRLAGRDEQTRGLIAQGNARRNKIIEVQYAADPTPVMSATVTYYKP